MFVYTWEDWDRVVLGASMAGAVARTRPLIFRFKGTQGTYDLNALKKQFGVKSQQASTPHDLFSLVKSKKLLPVQYVLCANATDLNNRLAAISLASWQTEPTVVIPTKYKALADSFHLKMVDTTMRGDTPLAVWNRKGGKGWSDRNLVLTTNGPLDYAVFSQAFAMYADPVGHPTSPATKLMHTVFDTLQPQSAVFGWIPGPPPRELVLVTEASKRASWVHCADASINLPSLCGFTLKKFPVQPALAAPRAPVTRPNKAVHTVTLLWSDGDNIGSYDQVSFLDKQRWLSPHRGEVAMGWTMAPIQAELSPTSLAAFFTSATKNDEFVGGPSGIGYSYPDEQTQLKVFANLTAMELKRIHMTTVNSIQARPLKTYEDPTEYANPFLEHSSIDAVWIYDYFSYDIEDGKIRKGANGKPVIGARAWLCELPTDEKCLFSCGPGCETSKTIVNRLQKLPKDPTSLDSYTLVSLDAWHNSVEGVVSFVKALGPGFDVILPSKFAAAVQAILAKSMD
eukprot:TRINITY_DN21304_c0_g1_i1.p1 TRINITY_DN21304_c0_g1~~TRINITY_DN21304_c0_g1_i1.p1  ORF type:complete len:560 (+),score=39.75 TRINITY_DN21304_c0_g1_i1:149-1681(+)